LIPAREAVESEAVLWKISCVPEGSVEKSDERQPLQLACTTLSTKPNQFLGTFSKLRKATVSSCLSVRKKQLDSHRTEQQNNGTTE
jgi:hypothetical protein